MGNKLASIVFTYTVIVIIIIWILLLFIEYKREINSIETSITQIKDGHLEGLKAAVWDLSDERINNSLKAITSINHITEAEVRYLELIPKFDEHDVFRIEMFPLNHPIGGEIGFLYVLFSKSAIQSSVFQNTSYFIIVLIPILFMSLIILYIFRNLITKPLGDLSRYTNSLTIETLEKEFDLPGKSKFKANDELGILLNAINHMRLNIKNEDKQRKTAERSLRELQKYLENIINSIPSMIIGIDSRGAVTQWNHKTEIVSGVSSELAMGKYLLDIIPNLKPVWTKIQSAIQMNIVKSDSLQFITDDGSEVFEEIIISPLSGDQSTGAVIRVDDVSEKNKMEELIIQNEKMLSVGGLAAGIAHEINNPLAGMMQSASVLSNRLGLNRDIPANRKAAEEVGISLMDVNHYLKKRDIPRMLISITDAGQRIAEIVQNMLSFSRNSENKRSSFRIEDLFEKILTLVSTEFNIENNYDFKKIDIVYDYGKDIPHIVCERAKLQQVFLNILQNGAQAMFSIKKENYKPCFTIRTKLEKAENMIRIDIEDNGPGMEKSIQKRIFEPFFTTKEEGKGTGLGLSVSYFIITENHKGKLSVESTPGVGTTFTIKLPL